jgi:enterochelin esterase-like enzyme
MLALAAVAAAALLLPGFAPLQSGPQGGQVLQGVFPGTVRPGLVYLPPGFDPARRYPVAYLLHGLPGSPSEYLAGTGFLVTADAGIADGTLRPFVAVMPAAGPRPQYDGEWAGPWETALVDDVVPWVDAHLPTLAAAHDRTIGGLSAGGFGAVDIALRHPLLFGRVESWSGYFAPLRDGPFKGASRATLAANDPTRLVPAEAAELRAGGVRFFLSTGPYHSHWFRPRQTVDFARELRAARLPVAFHRYSDPHGEWRDQVATGLLWAFRATASP